ncbi:pre-mRNA-splicing factor ATP-dependent RNA helicase DEAH7 isoform X1 [Tanacetum coccineum]
MDIGSIKQLNTGSLTNIGLKMTEFPLDPHLAKLLLTCEEFSCVSEVLKIVFMLSAMSVFFSPKDRSEESDAAHTEFFVPESDHLTLLDIYKQWKANKYSRDWCNTHYLQVKALRKKAICSAFSHNTAKPKGIREYINIRNGMACHLHPTLALHGLAGIPKYVVYHELDPLGTGETRVEIWLPSYTSSPDGFRWPHSGCIKAVCYWP